MLTRVQLIKFRDDVDGEDIARFEEVLAAMPKKITGVTSWSMGRNINPMFPGNPLYHYVIVSTHATLRDLQVFHTHSYHSDEVWPHLDPDDPRCLAADHMTLVFE